ncbi:MAG: TonB-dependent receptor [Pseudomonadota bacterium]
MKIFSRTLRLATVPMALAAAFPSLAQSDVPSAEKRLSETVITATRTATRVDEVVSDVVVVDRAAIEASTARTLSELLARNAGLQTTANGGLGKNSTLFIRGTESRHTILLIDGVRFGSATAGQPNYDNIPVDMIERVEVLKGPASALYGSEGVGGVVQVFTRRGAAGFAPYASATVGSNNHVTLATGASGGEGGLRYSFGVQKLREKGFSSTNSHLPGTSFNPDRDGFDQESLSGSISYQLTPDWSVSGNLLYADGEVQLDDGPNRDARTAIKTQVASLGLKGKITSDWQTELRASTSADKSASIVAASPNRFNTRQNELSWQNNVSTPIGVAVLGLEQREQKIESTTPYPVSERTITSGFVGLNGSQAGHSWQANVRRDRNSQFGNANTYFAGYAYQFTPAWRAQVSHGTSFVAPSFNQLYFPNFGNPLLQPERGRNTDVGVTYTQGDHQLKLVRFDNQIRGFISNTTTASQVPRARIDGYTLSYDGRFGNLQLRGALDLLDPRNELNGRKLARRADEQVTLGADYTLGAWQFGTSLLYVGERFDDANNTPARALPSYVTLDLNAGYTLSKEWKLQASLNNLTDRTYETAYGYNQSGRTVYLTLRYTPK